MTTNDRPKLTKRQGEIYDFLRSYMLEHGVPPTLREVCRRFKISGTNGIICHFKALVRKGYLLPADGAWRAYRPAVAEIVVFVGGQNVRIGTTGPVEMTADEWEAWLRKSLRCAESRRDGTA